MGLLEYISVPYILVPCQRSRLTMENHGHCTLLKMPLYIQELAKEIQSKVVQLIAVFIRIQWITILWHLVEQFIYQCTHLAFDCQKFSYKYLKKNCFFSRFRIYQHFLSLLNLWTLWHEWPTLALCGGILQQGPSPYFCPWSTHFGCDLFVRFSTLTFPWLSAPWTDAFILSLSKSKTHMHIALQIKLFC